MEYLDKIKDLRQKYSIILKYGQKFLAECPQKTSRMLKAFITTIMNMKKSGNDPMISYENLIKIFINQENLLEELLQFIMISDENCDASIIHRRIELYLDKLSQENKNNNDSKYNTSEAIIDLIKNNKKYQSKIDKNYVLMIFKMHNFTTGIIALSELMELRQELLSIYMDNHSYDKIINICENYGKSVNVYFMNF